MNIRTSGLKQRADGSRYMVGLQTNGHGTRLVVIELPAEEAHDLTAEMNFIRTGGWGYEL